MTSDQKEKVARRARNGSTGKWLLSALVYILALGGIVAFCLWAPLTIVASLAESTRKRYERALPPQLETDSLLFEGNNRRDPFDYISGFMLDYIVPPDLCGGALFRLSAATDARIKQDGLGFLSEARRPRGFPVTEDAASQQITWFETPVPAEWHGEGPLSFAFYCIDMPNDVSNAIDRAAKMPGSYYAGGSRGFTLVMPSLGAVLITFLY